MGIVFRFVPGPGGAPRQPGPADPRTKGSRAPRSRPTHRAMHGAGEPDLPLLHRVKSVLSSASGYAAPRGIVSTRPPMHNRELLEEFRRLGRRLSDATVMFHQVVADRLGLNLTDYKVVGVLRAAGPITAGRLPEITGVTTGRGRPSWTASQPAFVLWCGHAMVALGRTWWKGRATIVCCARTSGWRRSASLRACAREPSARPRRS